MTELVNTESRGSVTLVTLNRAHKRNALSVALRDAIEDTFARLQRDDSVRAVVLSGGLECFSAGYDLVELYETKLQSLLHRGVEYTCATYLFPKPLVVAIAGPAVAGGFDLAMAGDWIVAADTAKLGRPEVGWSINPLMCRVSQRIGLAATLRFTMEAKIVNADTAKSLGLVDEVVKVDALIDAACARAQRYAELPDGVVATMKQSLDHLAGGLREQVAREFETSAQIVGREEVLAHLERYAAERGILSAKQGDG